MPAQMLIDKSGILRFVYYGQSMSDIPSVDDIEQALLTQSTD
jgi:peroxiredoxin Q/BCP